MTGAIGFAFLLAVVAAAAGAPREAINLALGRPYAVSPPPNYPHCTDPGDATQLTDGRYTQGYFWTQSSTVGWTGRQSVAIVIDLGDAAPIGGLRYSTAAGVAGVHWPSAVQAFVSADGRQWRPVGDLVALSDARSPAPAGSYATHRYACDGLTVSGRFVGLLVSAVGGYIFCDEIEVLRGEGAAPAPARQAASITEALGALEAVQSTAAAQRIVAADVRAVRAALADAPVSAERRRALSRELDAAEAQSRDWRPPARWRAILPFGPGHARVWAVRGALWRARGLRLRLWPAGRWDPLAPGDTPRPGLRPPSIALTMLRNEVRGAALNVTNPGPAVARMELRWRARGGPAHPPWLGVREVAWTATAAGAATASALPDAPRTRTGWRIEVPAGCTKQVWLSVDSGPLTPGSLRGALDFTLAGQTVARVPLDVRVLRAAMPAQLSLSLGGWDYTDGPGRDITESNLSATVAFLRRYHVDAPWATTAVMPFGRHDEEGRMVEPPDTARMDAWLDRWRGARTYCVFSAFDGPPPITPADKRRVREWIAFWAAHLRQRGVSPSRLWLLLVDEPYTPDMDRTVAGYAAEIRAAEPEVGIFEDPIWEDPAAASREMLESAAVLCPNRTMWIARRTAYESVYLPLQRAGKRLAFYSCSGPVRSLDPYAYHRLQAWDCFRYGMVHMGYWAFCDAGGGSAWNELTARGVCFSPQFLDADGCTTSKHMEAIREGLYDHQTLVLLREAADRAERAGRDRSVVTVARRLLEQGPRAVTEAPGASEIGWAAPKDRGVADRWRARALALLERLAR